MKETTVTRKYQITIPKDIREIVIDTEKRVQKPSDYLWNISKAYTKIDVVHLVKRSRKKMR